MRQVIRRQHKALATEESYVCWLRRYMAAVRWLPESLTSEQRLERFLTHLAVKQDVSAGTQNQAFDAIVFFYTQVLRQPLKEVNALRAQRPARLRTAPTVEQTLALLRTVKDRGGYPTSTGPPSACSTDGRRRFGPDISTPPPSGYGRATYRK